MDKNSNILYDADLYVRLSKEDGDIITGSKFESDSISNQKGLLMQFLVSHPEIKLHAIREDDGYTGTNFNRPGFQLLLQDVIEKKINCVIVKDLSRLGRNYLKVGEYVQNIFPDNGIRFISVNDNYDSVSSTSPNDDIIISFKNLLNDAYSRDISIKIRSNLEVKRKRGEFTGPYTVFGYKKSENNRNVIVVDNYAAKVVKDIFAWKLDGMNQSAIAERLNSLGIPSPMEYKKVTGISYQTSFKINTRAIWCAQSVSRVLKNEIYTGTLIQGIRSRATYRSVRVIFKDCEDWIRKENNHEPIIDRLEFNRVQEIMARDTRTAPKEDRVYTYSGLIFCGDCGRSMVRKTVPGSKGRKYTYFICSQYKKNRNCSAHSIKVEILEQMVLLTLQKHIGTVLDVDSMLDQLSEQDLKKKEVEKLDERILLNEETVNKCRKLHLSLYEDLKSEIINKEEYYYLKAEYQRRSDEAMEAIKYLRSEIEQIGNNNGERKKWTDVFKNPLHMKQVSRMTANQLIDKITIYHGGRIGIRFKFQDKYDACIRFILQAKQLIRNQEAD